MNTKKKTTEQFIKEANIIHNNKYDYSKVEYKNAQTKVCIICPQHGEFWQKPYHHLQGVGCPKCKGEKNSERCRKTKEQFIADSIGVHGNRYDYSKVEYVNNSTKVCIICPQHGEFWQKPNDHLSGHGCPKCKSENSNLTTEEFIEKARKAHGDRYDYSKVEYTNSKTKVCIICPIHGEFWQLPILHLNGHGCIRCNNGAKPYTQEEFIDKAKEIHGDRYDYSKVKYERNDKKVTIICCKHGEFLQTPHVHLRGCGCPICSESILERTMAAFLESIDIEFQREYLIKHSKTQYLDFYLPKQNIAIECQGIQHFEPIDFFDGRQDFHERIVNDNLKYQYCINNNIKIVYYTENYAVEKLIDNEIYGGIYKKENIFTNLNKIYDQI